LVAPLFFSAVVFVFFFFEFFLVAALIATIADDLWRRLDMSRAVLEGFTKPP
jgi:hypothetical protein